MKPFRIALITLILALGLSACNFSLKGGKLTVPITLDEQAVIRLLTLAQSAITATSGGQSQVTINSVDFIEPDSVRVDGVYESSPGEFVPGSMTVAFAVADGAPRVGVTALDIPGADDSDARMEEINRALEDALQREVGAIQAAATFKSIAVEGNTLKIIVEVPLRATQ